MFLYNWTHYDLDGVVSQILIRAAVGKLKDFQCGYGKRQQYIDKLIGDSQCYPNDKKYLIITDLVISPKDINEKLSHYFDEILFIDHHGETVLQKDDYNCKTFLSTKKAAAGLVFEFFEDKLKEKYEYNKFISLKNLATLANDYDMWIHKHELSYYLNSLFWHYHWGKFQHRFKDGFGGLTDDEIILVRNFSQEQKKKIADQEQYTIGEGENGIFVITKPGVGGSLTDDFTIFDKRYNFYFIYQPDQSSMSIRIRNYDVNIAKIMTKYFESLENKDKIVVSYGGHPYAAAIEFTKSENKISTASMVATQLYELCMEEKKNDI